MPAIEDPFGSEAEEAVDLTDRADLLDYLRYTEQELADLTDRKARIRAEIDRLLGGSTIGLVNGKEVVKKVTVRRDQFSARRLQEQEPDVYDRYVRTTEFTQLRIKKGKS